MSSVVIAGDTSGTVTLAAPAVAGTTTLTLPSTSGTLSLTASPTFTGQATIPTINLTGGQITFPATQSASSDANTLDDYEEGTWTPTIVGSTSGSATIGALNAARYIKIGKQVTIWTDMQSISKNTLNGIARLSLPFTASTGSYPTGVMRYDGLTSMGTSTVVDPVVSPGTNFIFFQSKNATGYVVTDLTNSNFNATFALYMVTVTYEVA